MIELPPVLTPAEVGDRLGARVVVWASPSVRARLAHLPWPLLAAGESVPHDIDGLVAAGGGTLIDQAKLLRASRPGLRLGALPTMWGSGAEASPIAVLNTGHGKQITVAPGLRPDVIVHMPELARTGPADRARDACGDVWAHALEGALSPLAAAPLRADLADVMARMLALPLAYAEEWLILSALACAGQAQSSVGLVHGIAHGLEHLMHDTVPSAPWTHARLCSLFLLPVMRFNQAHSRQWSTLAEQIPVDEAFAVMRQLFDPVAYAAALPVLQAHWITVLRDPCSRTNSSMVRPADLAFFESFQP